MFWILNFFPSLLVHLVLIAGILLFLAASFLGMIPFVKQYRLPGQILGFVLAVIGVFYEGGLSYKESMDKEVAELKVKLAKAETESAEKNTQIQSLLDKDTTVIREKGQTIIKYLQTDGRRYDSQCVIPQEIIDAHNQAATLSATPSKNPDESMPLPPRTSP
jgi:hypothetical protein